MNTRCHALALLFASGCLLAAQQPTTEPAVAAAPRDYAPRTTAELDQLLGPIALYPDALIALILPAATVPADIVLAARQLKDSHNDLAQVEGRAWDESVKSLTHYPDVLKWMDENLSWTKQIGEAFEEEPAAVMESIQRLRAQARDAGTLFSTPQQQVLTESGVIRIVPAQPDLIYVPRYSPDIVYLPQPAYYPNSNYYPYSGYYPYSDYYPYSNSYLTFGVGLPVGSWLAYDFDWRRRAIWMGDRHRRWSGHDWHRPLVPIPPGFVGTPAVHQWRPPPRPPRPSLGIPPRYTSYPGRPPRTTIRPTLPYSTRGPIADARPEVVLMPRTSELNSRIRGTAASSAYAGPRVTPAARSAPTPAPTGQFVPVPTQGANSPLVRRGNFDGQRDRNTSPRNTSNPAVNPVPQPGTPPVTMTRPAPSYQPGTGYRSTWQPAPAPTVVRSVPIQSPPPPPIQAASPAPARQPPPPAPADDRRGRRAVNER